MPEKKSQNSDTPRASAFEATRASHHLEAAEDYTELVADLIDSNGEARIKDISKHLGISHVTALRTISRLQKDGYLETAPRAPVKLTAKGAKLAKYCKNRHQVLLDFFIALGVPRKIAEHDVEGVEHHISKTTLEKIQKHLNKL